MKTTFNLTTCSCDMDRFNSRKDFLSLVEGFDGVELQYFGEDVRRIVPKDKVVGMHLGYFPYWLDFWKNDLAACRRELGGDSAIEAYYGGLTPQALVSFYKEQLERAKAYGAEYMVFHVSDCSALESFTLRYRHSSKEVIEGVIELVNEAFPREDGGIALLFENLWQPGLTLLEPELLNELLEGVKYPNTGVMLDTGHLIHTELSLKTQEEALSYVEKKVSALGDLKKRIRGIHLQQSLTGEYMAATAANPPVLSKEPYERTEQLFRHAFRVDQHKPFTAAGIGDFVKETAPEYLTFEFMSESLSALGGYLEEQKRALLRPCSAE